MTQTRELFASMTAQPWMSSEALAGTVDALQSVEEVVTACAMGMLAEEEAPELRVAVSRDLDCADVVEATRRVLTRGSGPDSRLLRAQLEACVIACERSFEECSRHAEHHTHCRLCSQATRRCADACRQALGSLGG